jgi:hypothetical protein
MMKRSMGLCAFCLSLGGSLLAAAACGSSSSNTTASTENDGGASDATTSDGGVTEAAVDAGNAATFNVFDQIPQFGIYVGHDPADYTPRTGVLMWSYGTVFVTKLSATQQSQIGADLAARITFLAQCDNYDRLGGIFVLLEPRGQTPQPSDPRIEIVRFITPFSDYTQGALATHVYPNADISPYAQALADTSNDVWIGIAGGSNPYGGDPCTALDAGVDFSAIGFKYSLDFVSTTALTPGPSTTLVAVSDVSETTVPVAGTFASDGGALSGTVTVIVSGHGAGAGGDEYEFTQDTVSVNGASVGSFSTQIDCASYAQFSPDGNPGIFQGNTTNNPRNWCPGAFVPAHTFPAMLNVGANTVSLGITPSAVPSGSYFATSITFSTP